MRLERLHAWLVLTPNRPSRAGYVFSDVVTWALPARDPETPHRAPRTEPRALPNKEDGMAWWFWIILGAVLGALCVSIVVPRVVAMIRSTPSAALPEGLAPGWYAQCARCGRTRTLASVGGVRIGGNRGAKKATLAWCRGCRGIRVIRIVHESRMEPSAEA